MVVQWSCIGFWTLLKLQLSTEVIGMAESNLLLSTAQSEFKEDVIRALLLDDTINVNVKRSLEGLSSKRNFKLEELRRQWLNRGGHNYLTIKQIIETNV